VVNKRGSYISLKAISIMMVASRLLGTLLAQVFFIPGAKYVA
ncbi:lipid II flippase family protein, partial [Halalkalibacter alkalisediminis]